MESRAILYNDDCNIVLQSLKDKNDIHFGVCYADCIYESLDFSWANLVRDLLDKDGVFYLQTDDHTYAEWKIYLDSLYGKQNYINTLITIQEWGGTSNRFFPRKHDYILFYAKGKNYKFYPEKIKIPKVMAGTKLDKKGTGTKIPCDVFYDLGNFSTISKERMKDESGKNIRWQKPLKLYNRILQVCTDKGDWILDPFMGSGSLGKYCIQNKLNYVGIEKEKKVYSVAKKNIELNS